MGGEISPLPSIEPVRSEGDESKVLVCIPVELTSSLMPPADLKFVLKAGSSEKNAGTTDRAETNTFLTAARVVVQQSCKLASRTGMILWLLLLGSLMWLTVQASLVLQVLV